MALRSERGTVTAELAIALPAVLVVLTFALQVLAIQAERISLIGELASQSREAARGESVSGAKVEGNFVCVTGTTKTFVPVTEKQCARRLGM